MEWEIRKCLKFDDLIFSSFLAHKPKDLIFPFSVSTSAIIRWRMEYISKLRSLGLHCSFYSRFSLLVHIVPDPDFEKNLVKRNCGLNIRSGAKF